MTDALAGDGPSKGDEVEGFRETSRQPEGDRERRAGALARIDRARWPLPPDYKFDREEAHGRAGFRSQP